MESTEVPSTSSSSSRTACLSTQRTQSQGNVVKVHLRHELSLNFLKYTFSMIGEIRKILKFWNGNLCYALVEFEEIRAAKYASEFFVGEFSDGIIKVEESSKKELVIKYNNDKSRDYTNPDLPSGDTEPGNGGRPGCVLNVTNLNPQRITADLLFTLFGVYGDVQRVEIAHNRNSALVEMRDMWQIQSCMNNLNRIPLHGNHIEISTSQHVAVHVAKAGEQDSHLSKDFRGSLQHRFKKPCTKDLSNICPPNHTLLISGITAGVTTVEITNAFQERGFELTDATYVMNGGRHLGFLTFPSIANAVEALLDFHNFEVRAGCALRVSFAKRR